MCMNRSIYLILFNWIYHEMNESKTVPIEFVGRMFLSNYLCLIRNLPYCFFLLWKKCLWLLVGNICINHHIAYLVHVWIISLCFSEELSAAFFPGATETWAPHPLAAYPELAAPTAALHHHAALIQHPALAQVPVRVSGHFLYLLLHMCKTLGHNRHHGNNGTYGW